MTYKLKQSVISTLALVSFFIVFFTIDTTSVSAYEIASTTLFRQASTTAYWKLNNTSDSRGSFTLTNDNTVTFNRAVYLNGAYYTNANTNKCLRNDNSSPAGITYAQFATAWSVSAWVYEEARNAGDVNDPWGFQVVNATQRRNAALGSLSGQLYLVVFDGTANAIPTGYIIDLNKWYHTAVTYDGTKMRLYVNGILKYVYERTMGNTASVQTGGFGVGCNRQNTTNFNFWSGRVDDVAVFTKTLSQAEIQNLYALQQFFRLFDF